MRGLGWCILVGSLMLMKSVRAKCAFPVLKEGVDDAWARELLGVTPFVLRRPNRTTLRFQEMTEKESIRSEWGDAQILLTSANTYSTRKRKSNITEYLAEMDEMGQETPWYLFGDTRGTRWNELEKDYEVPEVAKRFEPVLSLGMGPGGSGVQFHTHGAAWAEVVHGKKHWFLSKPGEKPDFDPEEPMRDWADRFWQRGDDVEVLECTCEPGDVMYVPARWWHATLNVDAYNFFVSTFTNEVLPPSIPLKH